MVNIKKYTFCAVLFLAFAALSCEDYVQNVDEPINTISNSEVETQESIPFLVTGLKSSFAETHDELTVTASGLSDEQVFDRDVPQATFPSYDRLESGNFLSADGTINNPLGEFRFYADNLLNVVETVEFDSESEDIRTEALFFGNFFGGVARAWYASYMGLEPDVGGGIIDNGPFIPSDEMYDQAIAKLQESLNFANDYQIKVVNSTLARILLYQGNYEAARAAAENGLTQGDDSFQSLHSVQSDNEWYNAAGNGRVQFRWDQRFKDYVNSDPDETNRLPFITIDGRSGTVHYVQDLYPERSSPITFASWQETNLILAELELREGGANAEGNARALINEVRISHGLSTYSDTEEIDFDLLIEEREKELFTQGQRLIDQRRFDLWHLEADKWKYFPYNDQERNNNENID
jgi:hypothetical protein